MICERREKTPECLSNVVVVRQSTGAKESKLQTSVEAVCLCEWVCAATGQHSFPQSGKYTAAVYTVTGHSGAVCWCSWWCDSVCVWWDDCKHTASLHQASVSAGWLAGLRSSSMCQLVSSVPSVVPMCVRWEGACSSSSGSSCCVVVCRTNYQLVGRVVSVRLLATGAEAGKWLPTASEHW